MRPAARLRGLPTTTIAAALVLSALFGVPSAHAGVITIAWDPSPDPAVVGYRVHVGTTPGTYTETFDIGKTLTFSYNGVDGRSYYFAIAAYVPGPVVGPLSNEVSTTAGAAGSGTSSYWASLWAYQSTTSSGRARSASTTQTATGCWQPDSFECVQVQPLARVAERVSSLASVPDGRLLFVEGGRRLRLITSAGLALQPLIDTTSSSTRLNQVAVDPTFLETGFIWVSETHTAADGSRSFSVVRYRLAGDAVAERAGTISGMALPATGDAVFAIADSRHIYVAVPASADTYDPYWGMVLRFNPDGSIPGDSATGSAVLTAGYMSPSAIAPEPSSSRIWLSGVDAEATQPSLEGTKAGTYTALSVLPHGDHYDLLRVRGDGVLERVSAAHADSAPLLSFDPSALGYPLAIAAGADGEIFLSLYTPSAFRPVTIVALRPLR